MKLYLVEAPVKAAEPDPDAPDRGYPYISPPPFVDGRCHMRIAP